MRHQSIGRGAIARMAGSRSGQPSWRRRARQAAKASVDGQSPWAAGLISISLAIARSPSGSQRSKAGSPSIQVVRALNVGEREEPTAATGSGCGDIVEEGPVAAAPRGRVNRCSLFAGEGASPACGSARASIAPSIRRIFSRRLVMSRVRWAGPPQVGGADGERGSGPSAPHRPEAERGTQRRRNARGTSTSSPAPGPASQANGPDVGEAPRSPRTRKAWRGRGVSGAALRTRTLIET